MILNWFEARPPQLLQKPLSILLKLIKFTKNFNHRVFLSTPHHLLSITAKITVT